MKKVLIAVDYHPNSEIVVNAGYELAKKLNAQVCLIHVVADIAYYGTSYPTFMGYDGYAMEMDINMQGQVQKVSKDYLASIASHLDDTSVLTQSVEGDTANSILDYAKEWNADMIVMGTHSHGILEKIVTGTVTSKVTEHTTVPVYLVPIRKE